MGTSTGTGTYLLDLLPNHAKVYLGQADLALDE